MLSICHQIWYEVSDVSPDTIFEISVQKNCRNHVFQPFLNGRFFENDRLICLKENKEEVVRYLPNLAWIVGVTPLDYLKSFRLNTQWEGYFFQKRVFESCEIDLLKMKKDSVV